jgi:mono/diheme cytochrome c family protein
VVVGSKELPNSGSRWGTVPRFGVGNARMYVESRREIEEFVRFGAPRAWLADESVRQRLATQRLRMPAYEDHLNESEIRDVVAYVAALEQVDSSGGRSEGRGLADRHGCLGCHGVEGSGGLPNPGSLGGFIPGFVGGNFEDMVGSEEEFREWVLEGESSRLAGNPVVRFFWRRQAISMPAYSEDLTRAELRELWLWIVSLRESANPDS